MDAQLAILIQVARSRTERDQDSYLMELLKENRENLIAYLCSNYSDQDAEVLTSYKIL